MAADRPRRVLLVASAGGHLAQLLQLRDAFADFERTWVTFDTASLDVGDDRIIYCHHPTTRNAKNLARNFVLALNTVRATHYDLIVSTGAAAAIPFFVAGRLRGAKTMFIEVFDRIDSATLTGKLARPIVHEVLVQWPEQRSAYPSAVVIGPVYRTDRSAALPLETSNGRTESRPANVFVTVGTDHHRFDRLIEVADALASEGGHDVTVQHGASKSPRVATGVKLIDADEMRRQFGAADAVICHAGPSTIVEAMAQGHRPVVVPRDPARGEHVDDHQIRFGRHMASRGGIELISSGATITEVTTAVAQLVAAGVGASRSMQPPTATIDALRRRIDRLCVGAP